MLEADAQKRPRVARVDEVASEKIAQGVCIPVAKEEIAQTAAEAVEDRQKNRLSRCRQSCSAGHLHKSDIGGVVLNINSTADVKKAFNTSADAG